MGEKGGRSRGRWGLIGRRWGGGEWERGERQQGRGVYRVRGWERGWVGPVGKRGRPRRGARARWKIVEGL